MKTEWQFEGEPIDQKRIEHYWKKLYKNEPMPRIEGVFITEKEWKNMRNVWNEHNKQETGIDNYVGKCAEFEWGKDCDGTAAVTKVFMDNQETWLILIRFDSHYQFKKDLIHELEHIHNKDGEKCSKWIQNKFAKKS